MPESSKSKLFFCVVEDDPLIAELARNLLEAAGHSYDA